MFYTLFDEGYIDTKTLGLKDGTTMEDLNDYLKQEGMATFKDEEDMKLFMSTLGEKMKVVGSMLSKE